MGTDPETKAQRNYMLFPVSYEVVTTEWNLSILSFCYGILPVGCGGPKPDDRVGMTRNKT